MTRVLEHFMIKAWSIVITGGMKHFDEKCMEHCDEKGYGSLCLQGLWSIVMTRVIEHCDDRGHGAL